jgi:imidazolonepropionase-like amidohydrolase
VVILAGTDANAAPSSPAKVAHGTSLHDELERLVAAGLSNVEALRAATALPAAHFGLEDRGRVASGLRADLVLVRADPTLDVRATIDVVRVFCAGREVARS